MKPTAGRYIAFNIRRTIRFDLIYLNASSLVPLSLSKTLSRLPIYQRTSYFSSPPIQKLHYYFFFFFYPASFTMHHPLFPFPIFRCLLHLLKIRKYISYFLIFKFHSKIFNSFLASLISQLRTAVNFRTILLPLLNIICFNNWTILSCSAGLSGFTSTLLTTITIKTVLISQLNTIHLTALQHSLLWLCLFWPVRFECRRRFCTAAETRLHSIFV